MAAETRRVRNPPYIRRQVGQDFILPYLAAMESRPTSGGR